MADLNTMVQTEKGIYPQRKSEDWKIWEETHSKVAVTSIVQPYKNGAEEPHTWP